MADNTFPTSPLQSGRVKAAEVQMLPEANQLVKAVEQVSQSAHHKKQDLIHVPDVGGRLTYAYETLRNAAEYSAEHLMMRRAIERYLRRNANWRGGSSEGLGRDLVTELTQARYLPNDSLPVEIAAKIEKSVENWKRIYALNESGANLYQLNQWVDQMASVEIERLLVDERLADVFSDFAYGHYQKSVSRENFEPADDQTYFLALYLAMHRGLMESDLATARYYALSLDGDPGSDFINRNTLIDELFQARLTNQLTRLIQRNGAPMRVINEIVRRHPNAAEILSSRRRLQSQVEAVCEEQYELTRKRLNSGIIRSVAFIFLTKMLIGLAIEIPYDLIVEGSVVVLPLVLNLIIPPLYMATLGLGIRRPNRRNTGVILDYVERILYPSDNPVRYTLRRSDGSKTTLAVFNLLYAVTFLASFGIMIWILNLLGFNAVQAIIFFVFLSAVSFFGFRLTQSSKEYIMVDQREGARSIATDFFMTPFIRVGQWLSDKYSRLNIVTLVLDTAIEMPLKITLRLLREWMGFLRDKREEL